MRRRRFTDKVTNTRRWKRLRWEILRRDRFRCVLCGTPGPLEIDHVLPVRSHPELGFDPANLQTLCPSCHGRKTQQETGNKPLSEDRRAWAALLKEPFEC